MSEEYKSYQADIKKALLQGGLIVARRGAGKTSALAEILKEDPHAVVVINHQAAYDTFIKLGVKPEQIIRAGLLEGSTLFGKLEDKRLYGDNLGLGQIERMAERREFHAAVTTIDMPVRVIK